MVAHDGDGTANRIDRIDATRGQGRTALAVVVRRCVQGKWPAGWPQACHPGGRLADSGPAGWYPDPAHRHAHRYWSGAGWSHHVADAGTSATGPLASDALEHLAPPDPEASDLPVAVSPGGYRVGPCDPVADATSVGLLVLLTTAAIVAVTFLFAFSSS